MYFLCGDRKCLTLGDRNCLPLGSFVALHSWTPIITLTGMPWPGGWGIALPCQRSWVWFPLRSVIPISAICRAQNYKRNLLVWGTSNPKIYLSERLRACPDLLATNQLNYQLILQKLSWGQGPFKSTCPPPFLLVPNNGTICFFNPALARYESPIATGLHWDWIHRYAKCAALGNSSLKVRRSSHTGK